MQTILAATRKGLFTWRRSGGGWRIERHDFRGDPVTQVLHDARDGACYAGLDLGHFGPKMHALRPDETNWEEIACPALPQDAGDGLAVKVIWALAASGPDAPGQIWAGTTPGGLFRSDDGGRAWRLNRELWDHPGRKEWFGGGFIDPGIHSICPDPRDSRRMVVGVSCGGVWETRDGGHAWSNIAQGMRAEYMPPERATDPGIQDPHLVVRCAADPDWLWAQHHNGIFVRPGGAEVWTEIKTAPVSHFGFAVAVHPHDPKTAWFVPATKDDKRFPVDGKVIVNRTRDGGATFETLRNGLPQQHAYDLVFRHALDVDAAGSVLAFGSSTGGLWVSEDGGDAWQELSSHLPPIYCVRVIG
jgi:hypothetical protein